MPKHAKRIIVEKRKKKKKIIKIFGVIKCTRKREDIKKEANDAIRRKVHKKFE